MSVLLMNKTSTNNLIFYFDKAKQKNACSGYTKFKNIPNYFVLLSRNIKLMLKRVKLSRSKNYSNVSLPAKMEKIYGMHKLVGLQLFWSGTPTFPSGTPTFCQMGVLNSCF